MPAVGAGGAEETCCADETCSAKIGCAAMVIKTATAKIIFRMTGNYNVPLDALLDFSEARWLAVGKLSEIRLPKFSYSNITIRDTDVTMEPFDGAAKSVPLIVENYRDFKPPRQLRGLIEDLLNAIPPKYLRGLGSILLTNQNALSRDQRRQKVSGRKGKSSLAEARGAYYGATDSSPAYVLLLVDNTLSSWPSWALRVPYFCYTVLSEVLYPKSGITFTQFTNLSTMARKTSPNIGNES
jgi:hypothetical protein